jgi:hypothetical protein
MIEEASMFTATADAFAVIDEAGYVGLVDGLTAANDDDFGLIAGLLFPNGHRAGWEEAFAGPLKAFRNAAPAGAKLHITDAFNSGNKQWIAAARAARQEIYRLIMQHRIFVVFLARRCRISRRTRDDQRDLVEFIKTQAATREGIATHFPRSKRKATRVIGECYQGLVSIIDGIAKAEGRRCVEVYCDTLDEEVLAHMEGEAARFRTLSQRVVNLTGFNKEEGRVEELGRLVMASDLSGVDVTTVKPLMGALGKDNPLVFAADVVVNEFRHRLSKLPPNAALNGTIALRGWEIDRAVFAVEGGTSTTYFEFDGEHHGPARVFVWNCGAFAGCSRQNRSFRQLLAHYFRQ